MLFLPKILQINSRTQNPTLKMIRIPTSLLNWIIRTVWLMAATLFSGLSGRNSIPGQIKQEDNGMH